MLSEQEEESINFILDTFKIGTFDFNKWEQDFIKNLLERYEKYKNNLFLSAKQLSVINRIEYKIAHDGEEQREPGRT